MWSRPWNWLAATLARKWHPDELAPSFLARAHYLCHNRRRDALNRPEEEQG